MGRAAGGAHARKLQVVRGDLPRGGGNETYVKVGGRWRCVYRAIDQFGQLIDVYVFPQRDAMAAHRFFERAIGTTKVVPMEVISDRATYPDGAGGAAPTGAAPNRAARQQPGRDRPRPPEVAAAADALPQATNWPWRPDTRPLLRLQRAAYRPDVTGPYVVGADRPVRGGGGTGGAGVGCRIVARAPAVAAVWNMRIKGLQRRKRCRLSHQ
jgi:DDE domain